MTKETKKDFCFLGLRRIIPCSYLSSFIMENQGHVVLYEKLFEKKTICSKMLISLFLIFENFVFFLVILYKSDDITY